MLPGNSWLTGPPPPTFWTRRIHQRPTSRDSGGLADKSLIDLSCPFQLLVVAGNLWCSLACRCITPISVSVFTWPSPLCVSLCLFFSYEDTSHTIVVTPPYSSKTSTDYIAKTLISKSGHILKFWVDMNFGAMLFNPVRRVSLCQYRV